MGLGRSLGWENQGLSLAKTQMQVIQASILPQTPPGNPFQQVSQAHSRRKPELLPIRQRQGLRYTAQQISRPPPSKG